MTKWSFFKPKASSRCDRLWIQFKSGFLSISDMESLHQLYVCDLQLEQQVCALSKLEDYFSIESELADTFRSFFSFIESEITFEIFAFYLWNFCTLQEKDLASFIFGIFSEKGSEALCRDHFIKLLKRSNNSVFENSSFVLPHVQYSARTFSIFCKENKEFLSPVLQMQNKLRNKCLGILYWVKESKKRLLKRQADDTIEVLGQCQVAVTLREVFTYYYMLQIKSTPLSTVANNFYSSQGCRDTINEDDIAAFNECPYDCLLSLHRKRRRRSVNICTDCLCAPSAATINGPEHTILHDTDYSQLVSLDMTSKSHFDSYRNQVKLKCNAQNNPPSSTSCAVKHVSRRHKKPSTMMARHFSNPFRRHLRYYQCPCQISPQEEGGLACGGAVSERRERRDVEKNKPKRKRKQRLLKPPGRRNNDAQIIPLDE
jgi:hypothetical protein